MNNLYKIASINRSSGAINDFNITFNYPLQEGYYQLKNAIIPNSIYIVNDTNNKIYFNEFGSGSDLTATLLNGNYTTTTLATEIGTQMTAVSGFARTYTATYSSLTNKFTITVSASTFKMRMGTNTTNSARYITGYNTDDATYISSHTSDIMVNLSNNVYSCNIVIQSQNMTNYLYDNSNTLFTFSVPITVSFGNVSVYEPIKHYHFRLDGPTRNLKIQVRDDLNNLVQLNSDFSLVLEREPF
jgi:hypothetical protein